MGWEAVDGGLSSQASTNPATAAVWLLLFNPAILNTAFELLLLKGLLLISIRLNAASLFDVIWRWRGHARLSNVSFKHRKERKNEVCRFCEEDVFSQPFSALLQNQRRPHNFLITIKINKTVSYFKQNLKHLRLKQQLLRESALDSNAPTDLWQRPPLIS